MAITDFGSQLQTFFFVVSVLSGIFLKEVTFLSIEYGF